MSLSFVKVSLFLLLIRQCSLFSFEYALKKVDSLEARLVALETVDHLRRLEIDEIFVQFSEFDKKFRAMNMSLLSTSTNVDVNNCKNSIVSTDGHSLSYLVKGMAAEKLLSYKNRKDLERLISSLKNVFSDHKNKFEEMTKMLKSEIDQNRDNLINGQALLADTCDTIKEGYRNEIASLKAEFGQMTSLNAEFVHAQLKKMKNEIELLKDVSKNHKAIGIESCVDLLRQFVSGIYQLNNGLKVYCDQTTDGGGWIVFQRREDGNVDFERTWDNYKTGFGDLLYEFWLGNDNLHVLTEHGNHELRIDIEDFEGNKAYAKYSHFKVHGEVDKYRLEVSGYSGNAGDSLSSHNKMAFSTVDRDNDPYNGNCAKDYRGAWWYLLGCHYSNLNGFYYHGSGSPHGKGVIWYHWKESFRYSLKRVEMKLRST
ncbi:fibrinogen-like protein 1 [Ruditapes philippinarum]|uniref:fibrinogen-like protein 1 n=1 Tax=Ruditapes philippinarum TaxID=129788 RepID=UPI00295BEA27|nr:fibrinogen-like protein 1 [Ruditapes philippinarum]